MLRYIHANDLTQYPRLSETMFRDRAAQFHERLSWEVEVDASGAEHDAYDKQNPVYVIWERQDGTHGGSMRYMPTTGATMVNDHFSHLSDGLHIASPLIWECTRFCQAPGANARISALLMLGSMQLGLGFGLSHIVGVFDARMVRIYRRLGWGPTILGTEGKGREANSVGLWDVDRTTHQRLLLRAGVSAELSQLWFDRGFANDDAREILGKTG